MSDRPIFMLNDQAAFNEAFLAGYQEAKNTIAALQAQLAEKDAEIEWLDRDYTRICAVDSCTSAIIKRSVPTEEGDWYMCAAGHPSRWVSRKALDNERALVAALREALEPLVDYHDMNLHDFIAKYPSNHLSVVDEAVDKALALTPEAAGAASQEVNSGT